MSKHEEKTCPRCKANFECKVGDITQCQCYGIKFTNEEIDYIAKEFVDCLCFSCMKALQSEYNISQKKMQLALLIKGR